MDDAHAGEIRENVTKKLPYSSRWTVSIENAGLQTANSSLTHNQSHRLETLLLPIRHQHDLTDHASAFQQFVCVPRLAERQPLCDQRLDLLLLQ